MTDRPHTFRLRSSATTGASPRRSSLKARVFGVELRASGLLVRTADFGLFTRRVPAVARARQISLFELAPTDDTLESVFAYLVGR